MNIYEIIIKELKNSFQTFKTDDMYLIEDILKTENVRHFQNQKLTYDNFNELLLIENLYIEIIPTDEFFKNVKTWADLQNKIKDYQCELIDDVDEDDDFNINDINKIILAEKWCGFGYILFNKTTNNIIIIE